MLIYFIFILIATNVRLEKSDELILSKLNTSVQTNNKQIINNTNIYEKLLSRISNYCLSKREVEEIYGNKSKAGLVSLFHLLLIDGANKQIGLNELRHLLHLKKQKINYNGQVLEEFEDKNKKDEYKALGHFQEKVSMYSWNALGDLYFWPEDIQNAEIFLDKRFPEVRQLFKLKYEEKEINKKPFNNQTIDEILLEFMEMQSKIYEATSTSTKQTFLALYRDPISTCYLH
ncbi:hypothetical protein ACQ4LE_001756 [Meloidogyne hapla]